MAWVFVFLTLTFLILISAFYVAAEFSTVSARRSRIAQMAEEGNRFARSLLPVVQNTHRLDTYIAACQLGITASTLILGFYGQAKLTPVIKPYLSSMGSFSQSAAQTISTTGLLLFLTTVQVILGELVPKSIGIQYPEKLALLTTVPMHWSMTLFKPLIHFFNGSGRFLLRLGGVSTTSEHIHIHSPEEIILLFEESSAGGLLDEEERRLLRNSLQLRQLAVHQVMIPRTRMLAAPVDQPGNELLPLLADSPYSRLPLYEGSVDNIVGIVHLKDLMCLGLQTSQHDLREAMRPVLFVPETMPVDKVFALLQRKRYHVAIVLDEYGGTAGMVTLEDLIEEIFGELKDEFDLDITPPIRFLSENRIQIRGDMLVEELNEALDLNFPTQEVDTVGGLVLSTLGHVPVTGEKVPLNVVTLRVESMDGHGVSAVTMQITPKQRTRLQEWIP